MKNSLIVFNKNNAIFDFEKKVVNDVRESDIDFCSLFSLCEGDKKNMLSYILSTDFDNFIIFSRFEDIKDVFSGYDFLFNDKYCAIKIENKFVFTVCTDNILENLISLKKDYYDRLICVKEKFVFKYFGNSFELEKVIQEAKQHIYFDFDYFIQEKNGDHLVKILFKDTKSEDLSKKIADTKRFIFKTLMDKIYAEFDTSLSSRLFDLLKFKNKKISTAESFTGGRVVSAIIDNSGASAFVMEGAVTYSNYAKQNRLNVSGDDLFRVGAVSSEVAFQMAKGLLLDGTCDIAVSTTGIAGPKSDDTNKPVGLCYIGVGDRSGIDVYKYNLTGDREKITETAKNIALFLCIKKLKNI